MLKLPEKWRLIDKGGKNDFFCEVNWRDDKEINDCKIFRFTFPDGKQAFIEKKHLLEIFFACGNPEEQRKMIPQTVKRVKWFETVLGVKATKDIKKGEMMNFPIKISLPQTEEEIIGKVRKTSGGLIIPK